jgi:SNF2 family DNA or RNA helicase
LLSVDLYPYQNDAVDRMLYRRNMLLAYETGLGKTVVSVAVIEELLGKGEISQALIVALPGLKYQWAQQIAKLTDVKTREISVRAEGYVQTITVPTEEYCIFVDGTPLQRKDQYQRIKDLHPDYVIIGYPNVVDDWTNVRRIRPQCIVLDEITAIKTFKAQRTRKIKRLTAPYRFGLTATPIDNGKPEEIFSIMQWVDDRVLGRFDYYDRTYIVRNKWGAVERYKNLPVLHRKMAEVLVRKTSLDPDVAPYMPELLRSKVIVKADTDTKRAYNVIAKALLKELKLARQTGTNFDLFAHYHGMDQPNENTQQGRIMAKMGALDMLLDHPDLVIASAMKYEDAQRQQEAGVVKKNWEGSKYCYELWQKGVLDEVLTSPKLKRLMEEVHIALDTNPANKVIIFSVHPDMLEIILGELPLGLAVLYHGRMGAGEKAASVARFTQDADCRVFLSSHAGAHGTDLFMANYLFNYDHAYGSGQQTQIDGRHQRASSEFTHVHIKDMLVEGSVEVRRFDGLALKRRVESAIVDGTGADNKGRVENDLMSLTEYLETSSL